MQQEGVNRTGRTAEQINRTPPLCCQHLGTVPLHARSRRWLLSSAQPSEDVRRYRHGGHPGSDGQSPSGADATRVSPSNWINSWTVACIPNTGAPQLLLWNNSGCSHGRLVFCNLCNRLLVAALRRPQTCKCRCREGLERLQAMKEQVTQLLKTAAEAPLDSAAKALSQLAFRALMLVKVCLG